MNSAGLLNETWALLAADDAFLGFKGLNSSSPTSDKVAYIQKHRQTQDIVTSSTIPIALIYIMPGFHSSKSITIYRAKVIIECYASSLYTAVEMTDRAGVLVQNWSPSGFMVAHTDIDTSVPTGITGIECQQVSFTVEYFVG